jgi:hypothetical protein
MTVTELMGLLEEEPEDAVVRILHQQSWPLQEVVGGIASDSELFDEEPEEVGAAETLTSPVVYLEPTATPKARLPTAQRALGT